MIDVRHVSIALLLAACHSVPSEESIARLEQTQARVNAARMKRALAGALRDHDLTEITVGGATQDPSTYASGLSLGPDGHVIYSIPGGAGCSPGPQPELHFARDGAGTIYVIALEPDVHTQLITRPGTCAEGCGVEAAWPGSAYLLPATSLADVKVLDLSVEQDTVDETCEHPMPAP